MIFIGALEKPFMPIDKQILQLKNDRNLLFQSEETAKLHLTRYGYYEIVNGYKDHFMKDEHDDNAGFIDGITFEHIYALFNFDKSLREQVMSALENFESNLRQVVAYTVAEQISDDQNLYLKRYRYNVGKKYQNRWKKYVYPIDNLLKVLTNITFAKTEPYKHYREEHHNIPPWIIVKRLSFGNLIWWVRLLKRQEKDLVISRMLGISTQVIQAVPEVRTMFGTLLTLYLNYRNVAAHGGRIYNHKSTKYELPYNSFLHPTLKISKADYRVGKGHSRFGILLKTLQLFENKDPHMSLEIGTHIYLNQYLQLFPKDKDYIYKKMEITDSDFTIPIVSN